MLLSQEQKPSGFKKDIKLKFKEYDFIADENPEQIVRQRVKGSITGTSAFFSTQPTMPNMLLSAKAYIKWTFSMTKKKNAIPAVDENFGIKNSPFTQGDVIVMKPFMCIANATKQIRLSINGSGIVYNEPRYWQKYMGQLFCPNNYLEKYYSTSGGLFTMNRGSYTLSTGLSDTPNGSDGDPNLDKSADLSFQNYTDQVEAGATSNVDFIEPLYIGPFNWAYDIKDSLPKNYWGSKMSNLIPYVRDMNYTVLLDKLTANCFYYLYGRTSGAGFEVLELVSNGLTSAELVLEWIKPKDLTINELTPYPNIHNIASTQIPFDNKKVGIPDEVKLQSWYLDHKQFVVNNGNVVISEVTNTTLDIPVIHIYQVPSFILMFATVDKDNASYRCLSVLRSDNVAGSTAQSLDVNSLETNAEITTLNIQINADKDRISTRYSSRELYNLTLKNAKKDYPYDFSKYIGGFQRQANYPGNMCVLLSSDDLNITKTTGRLTRDFTFQATVDLLGHGGHHVKNNDGSFRYRFHLIFLYDKYYMKINKNGRVEYRYESVY